MNPGIQFSNWLMANLQALFVAGLAVFGLVILIKRKIMQGVILLIVAGVAGIFVFSGSEAAQKIADLVLSWFR